MKNIGSRDAIMITCIILASSPLIKDAPQALSGEARDYLPVIMMEASKGRHLKRSTWAHNKRSLKESGPTGGWPDVFLYADGLTLDGSQGYWRAINNWAPQALPVNLVMPSRIITVSRKTVLKESSDGHQMMEKACSWWAQLLFLYHHLVHHMNFLLLSSHIFLF